VAHLLAWDMHYEEIFPVFPETSVIGTLATLDFGVETPYCGRVSLPSQACKVRIHASRTLQVPLRIALQQTVSAPFGPRVCELSILSYPKRATHDW